MVTTSRLIELIIQLLRERGCKNITIGEGAIIGIFDELNPYTKQGFQGTGLDRLAKKYGVKLIDFNEGPFQVLDLGGIKSQISRTALETDFLINVPVLKTHFQTKVSLGFKNLKGCLSKPSKKRFHSANRLDNLIFLLNESIKSDLVIIDGIYMLEKGPETLAGTAYRKDLIIASPDIFECDVVGATILGLDPSQVDYLHEFAAKHNRSFDINLIKIEGERIEPLKEHLEWKFEPDKELLSPKGVTGLTAPPPGQTLCCACAATLALTLSILAKDNPKIDFGGAELYYGLQLKAAYDSPKTILYGNCALRCNKELQNATCIEGCPPPLTKTIIALAKTLLSKPRMARMLFIRFFKLLGIRLRIYHETFPKWERYQSKEFDKSYFSLK